MKRVELSGVRGARIIRADLELDAGVHTVVALTPEGAEELVQLAAGATVPKYGNVLIDGGDPHTRPDVRRKIGSLFAEEAVSETRSVEDWVARALALRGSSANAVSVLDAVGLGTFARRRPEALSSRDARGVALAVALAAAEGGVLLLFEPLATPAGRARVVEAIARAGGAGAAVLCVTASLRDAGDLGGHCYPMRFGRIGGDSSAVSLGAELASVAEMVVRTDDPRRLVSALSLDPVFSHVRSELGAVPGEVVVAGAETETVALAILRGAKQSGAKILALRQRSQPGAKTSASGVA